MSNLDQVILVMIAYLMTGVAIVGYDCAAPPVDKKGYVIQNNYRIAALLIVFWPVEVSINLYMEYKMRRPCARYMVGVIMLLVGFYMWARLIFIIIFSITTMGWIAHTSAGITMLFGSPLITRIAMPPHRHRRPTDNDINA